LYEYDKVSIKILKKSIPFIISPLNYTCNKAISTGIFPSHLKYSILKPVYEKGDKKEVDNYRPVSSLMSFSNVFENIIFNKEGRRKINLKSLIH
jgi:hypothetical protein